MSLRSILSGLRSVPPLPSTRRAWFRPRLEPLDDRCLPSFSPATSFPVGTYPNAVATADFNNDGRLDLATANWLGSSVSLLRGNADGTFQPAQTVASGANPVSIAVGDFNTDGVPDLVSGNLGAHNVTVMIGNGDGSFQPPVGTEVQGGDPYSVAVGDFNADGEMDVAVGTYNYYWGGPTGTQVQVLLGNGGGGFTHGDIETTPYSTEVPLAVADVNGDGRPDVLAASDLGMLVSVLLCNPDGTLSYTPGASDYPTGNNTRDVAVGDFTGDGVPDLLAAGYTRVAVLPGLGDGTFGSPIVTLANNSDQRPVAVADLDGDGLLDVVTADEVEGAVTALLGLGNGTFFLEGDHAVGASPKAVAVGDFDDDGLPDVVAANSNSNTLSVLLNDGNWGGSPHPPPPPTLQIDDVSVTEGSTGTRAATFTVTLYPASTQTVTVAYYTNSGTATAGSDFLATSGTLTFAPGETSKAITVSVLGDLLFEFNELFHVTLHSATGAQIVYGGGTGTIVDDDPPPPPQISISDVTKAEGKNRKTTLFTFTVTLSAASDQAVTMSYRTVDGTATTSDSDYVAGTGTLTFAPGETTKTITIEVKGDRKREAHETFYLDLFGLSSNALFTDSRGVGTIWNDDR